MSIGETVFVHFRTIALIKNYVLYISNTASSITTFVAKCIEQRAFTNYKLQIAITNTRNTLPNYQYLVTQTRNITK